MDEKLDKKWEEKLTQNIRFDSSVFSRPEHQVFNTYRFGETTHLENQVEGLKAELIGNTLWVWNEFGSLVAKIMLPVWVRSTIELMSYVSR